MGNSPDKGLFSCAMETQADSSEDDDEELEKPKFTGYEQIVWEFQRYKENIGWGAGNNFEPNDPGRYSNYYGTLWGDTLESVSPSIPREYKIDLDWKIVVEKRIKERSSADGGNIDQTSIIDRFGWRYADSFKAEEWKAHREGHTIRRRAWKRTLIKKRATTPNN